MTTTALKREQMNGSSNDDSEKKKDSTRRKTYKLSGTLPEPVYCDIDIGGMIRAHRKARDLTLTQLQERSGINNGSLSKIERGKQSLTNESITQLAKAFGIPIPELFVNAAIDHLTEEEPSPFWRDASEFSDLNDVRESDNVRIGTLALVQPKTAVSKGSEWTVNYDELFVLTGRELHALKKEDHPPSPSKLIRLKAPDNLMEPRIFKDDDLIIDLEDKHIPRQGGVYAVLLDGENIDIRRLNKVGEGLQIVCDNDRHHPPVHMRTSNEVKKGLQIVGRVVKLVSTNGF